MIDGLNLDISCRSNFLSWVDRAAHNSALEHYHYYLDVESRKQHKTQESVLSIHDITNGPLACRKSMLWPV
jgi:hypothetical protein